MYNNIFDFNVVEICMTALMTTLTASICIILTAVTIKIIRKIFKKK